MTTSIKTCFKCEAERPLTEFYKHKQMADGHLNKCKDCTKNDVFKRRHGSQSRERVLAYDRKRGSRQDHSYHARHREQNKVQYRARTAVSNAVRDGRIKKPDRCAHCNATGRVEGHHRDYSKPLVVTWLCSACHKQLHALLETVGNSSTV